MRLTFRQHDDFNEGDWYLIERVACVQIIVPTPTPKKPAKKRRK